MPQRDKPSAFSYDRKRGTYRRRSTGRYVSRQEIRSAIDTAITREQRALTRISQKLRAGSIALDTWQDEMASSLKTLHLWSASAAKGGWGELDASDYGKVGSRLREQYDYLDNFARQIERGEVNVARGQFMMRVVMYGDAARETYHSVLLSVMQNDVGMTEERNVLGEADHCNGCLAAQDAGWVPVGTLPLPGERDCLTRCKCDIIYR